MRCAGNVLSINNERTAAPFEIRAIGDPQARLRPADARRRGRYLSARHRGEGHQMQQLEIPAYRGLNFEYAKPSEGGGGS
ncbi:MAG: DUF881 domain-containing protein [Oscillospiraceae bacterium]